MKKLIDRIKFIKLSMKSKLFFIKYRDYYLILPIGILFPPPTLPPRQSTTKPQKHESPLLVFTFNQILFLIPLIYPIKHMKA